MPAAETMTMEPIAAKTAETPASAEQPRPAEAMTAEMGLRGGDEAEDICCGLCAAFACFECCKCCC